MELSGKLDNTAKTNIVIISPSARQDRLEAGLNIFGVTLTEKPQVSIVSQSPIPKLEVLPSVTTKTDAEEVEWEEVDAGSSGIRQPLKWPKDFLKESVEADYEGTDADT